MPGTAAALAKWAKWCWFGIVLSAFCQPPTLSGAAEADRAIPLAAFARPAKVPYPAEVPYTSDKAELGRKLFFDSPWSASGTTSCATSHHPRLSWADGLPRAVGAAHGSPPLRSPTVLGAAWLEAFGWDGKFPT